MRKIVLLIAFFALDPNNVFAFTCDKPYSKTLNYEVIKALIITCKLKTIDELLPLLPEQYKKSFTLMYQSNSAESESVDAEYPRVILFGDDSKFLLAFTTNPNKPFYNQLQIIQYRDDTSKFEFNSLEFNENGSVTENETAPIRAGQPTSHHPPQSCAACHDGASRPNWDSYRFWPGAFGSADDDFSVAFNKEITEPEYDKFSKLKKNSGRLGQLVWKSDSTEADVFAPYRNLMKAQSNSSEQGISVRPNLRLTQTVMGLNAKRILKKLKTSKLYDRLKFRLAAGLLSRIDYYNVRGGREPCVPFPEKDLFKAEAKQLISNTAKYKMKRANYKTKEFETGDISLNSFLAGEPRVSEILDIATIFDIDPTLFSTGASEDSFAISDGDQEIGLLLAGEILKELSMEATSLKKYLKFNKLSDPANKLVYTDQDKYLAEKIDASRNSLNLSAEDFDEVCKILKNNLPKAEIWPKHTSKKVVSVEIGKNKEETDVLLKDVSASPQNTYKGIEEENNPNAKKLH